jgi:pimeloyl-ACP methyl ester carboxylesterase
MEYTPEVWRDQTVDFVKEKISNNDVVIVGNSLGGYASIYAASQMDVSSVILLNPVAVFRQRELPFTSWFHWIAQPVIFRWLFHYFQSQIRPVLTTLYPCHPERVDDALVQSIEEPARDPNAREVFCKILQQQLAGKHPYMEDILQSVKMPVYLVVGKKDPWLLPTLYDDFLANCPTAFGKWVDAGHCPHDEIPDEVNHLILTFMTLSCEKI